MHRFMICTLLLILGVMLAGGTGWGQTELINSLGGTQGWYSEDTRNETGANLVGLTLTHYGKPGQTATVADDIAIRQQISFSAGPGNVGALKMSKTSVGGGFSKSTISKVNVTTGFATGDTWLGGFVLDYRYYTNSTAEVTVPKIGIQSTAWTASQTGFTAQRSGESVWDIILVDWRGTDPGWVVNSWGTFSTDKNTVCWRIYRQAGNGYHPATPSVSMSLQQIFDDPTWGPLIFGAGAKVTSFQLGVGSSSQTSTSYIDYVETNLLNGGNRVDFVAPVQNITRNTYFDNIQPAVDAAVNGDVIEVAPGTYSSGGSTITVNKEITIQGAGEALTFIDVSSNGASWGIHVPASNVTLKNFTIIPASGTTGGYPLHAAYEGSPMQVINNLTLQNITVNGSRRTGIDVHGVDNATISFITSTNATYGNGVQLTGCHNATLSNITTSGNAWGGLAIYVSGPAYLNQGSDNITIDGATCSFGEVLEVYSQVEHSLPITNVHANGFSHKVLNETYRAGAANYVHYFLTQAKAVAFATVLPTPLDSYIISLIDGSFLVAPGMSIQTAANKATAGNTVNVVAGTYEEQVEINKNLTLTGAGAATTTIKSPVTLTKFYTTSANNFPVVYVHDAPNVVISGLTVDGAGRGNTNYRFQGIGFRNAGGSVSNCILKDVRDTPFSGAQHGVALYVYNDDVVSRSITVANNTFTGFQKNAMALNAGATTPLVVDVRDNIVTGAGPTTITAQNGIQVWADLGSGTVADNTVTGIAYDNTASVTKWVATSILNYYGDLDITGNIVTGGHTGLYNIDGSGTISGNAFTIEKVGVSGFGIIATDPPDAVPSPFDGDIISNKTGTSGPTMIPVALTVNVTGNSVTFSGPDNAGTIGVEADAGYGPHDLSFSATNNTVHGFETGFGLYHCTSSCGTGVFTALTLNGNDIQATGKAIESDVAYLTADGTCNWYGTTDGSTIAGKISGLVTYIPYRLLPTGACGGGLPVQVTRAGTPISGHATIQGAINEGTTQAGDVITIDAGTYAENVTVNKAGLQLVGANAATTIVNGGGPGSTFAMNVTAAGVSISGMTFKNAQSGLVIAANNTTVRNSLFFENVGNGILIDNAAFNTIRGNTFHNNPGGAGVALVNAKQNVITANTFGGGSFANGKNISIAGTGVNPSRGNAIRANTFLAGSASSWYIYVESDPLTTSVNFNLFADSRTPKQYIYNSSATLNVNARYNWFDGITPPDASGFSGAVDRSFAFATDPTVSIFPESQYVSVGQPVTLDVIGLIPAGTEVKGSTIDMSWTNDAVIPDVSGPTDGGFFDVAFPVPGNPFFAVNNLSASSVRVDQSLLNNPGGVGSGGPMPYLRVFFSITFQPNATGTSVITLPTVTLRDPANAPITPVVILPAGGATLIADGDAPVVSDVLIDNTTLNTDQNSDTFDDFVKNTDGVVVTATVTDNNPLAAANIVADLTGLGGGPAVVADSYAGTLATWTLASVTCSPSDGTITVNVTATDVVSLTHTAGDNIIADNTPPTPPTAFVAKTDNIIGGHGKVALSWTAGTDTYGKSTVIRYNGWSYPTYPAGAPPAYPALPTDGSGITVTPMSATSHTHAITPRNIHYYSAFTLDWAGNYSAAPAAAQQDRAANYFLGDLGSGAGANLPGAGGYNGLVNFDDLIWFSGLYFSSSTSWNSTNNGAEADFGPTVANKSYAANHRFALPRPDGVINFEDLMIFSMNYMNTTPKLPPPADPQLARELAVELVNSRSTSQQGEILAVTVRLANDGREVKGVSTILDFDPTKLQFIDASPSGLFGSDQQGFFFSSVDNGKVTLDAAMLGVDRTVNFSGNIATARFRVLHAGQGAATIAQAIVRSGKNTEEVPSLNNNAVALPTTFGLVQNYPNPFNPSTRIEYQVPAASSVTIEVFNVLGAKIATLVNEVKDAGYHHVVWDGRNSANQQVASGIYFYTMTAGEFKSLKKMMLMK